MERALGGRGPEVLAGLQRMQALPGNYLEILERYVGHLVVEGIVQAHEDIRREAQREERRLSAVELGKLDADPVIPADALDFIRHRRDLGRFFERDQVDTVRRILVQALEEGWPTKRVEDELRRQLVGVSRHRAHTIARTEATTAFNQGRLAMFQQSGGYVVAVQFSAILDTRTTEMCRARHGLVLALEDAALAANTPPLHYSCRSYLLPISRYQLEKLGGADFLVSERAKIEGLPRPLPGFDQPEPPIAPDGAPSRPPAPTAPVRSAPKVEPAAAPGGRKFIERGIVRGKGKKVRYRPQDVDAAVDAYREAAKRVLPKLDRTDYDLIARYVDPGPASGNAYVWERIRAGGIDGFALLVHEAEELKLYFAADVNPWRADEQASRYHEFHGFATVREHRFLLAVAKQKGYPVEGIGDLIRTDANAVAPGTSEAVRRRQVATNLWSARRHERITPSTNAGLEAARLFWLDVMEGRLRLEDVDLDALQAAGILG